MKVLHISRRLIAAAALICAGVLPLLAETFEERVAPCLACHGEKGQSETPDVPSLGAQPAPYLLIQLYLFREKQRVVEIMNDMTKGFSDEDLRTFSDFLAKQTSPLPTTEGADAARLQNGRTLITQHRCNNCHNLDLSGKESIPRIAGQREDYLVKSMREYKDNSRPGYDPAMASVLAVITDEQILDLAYAVARFR